MKYCATYYVYPLNDAWRSGKSEDKVGNFVYEAGWCVARDNRDKDPGQSVGLRGSTGYHVD